jgi:2-succinyl-6-hydroxy-2,4-cyclohexadiene-1-carboxylate synthase
MTVVALHGFTGSGADFDALSHRLSVPLVAPDLLGHGDAPDPAEPRAYRMSAQARRIAADLDDGPVVLLGYSLGGRVALRLWPLLRDRLRGMVLIGAHPGLTDPVERAERMAADHALAGQIEEQGMGWFLDHWAQQPIIRSQAAIPPEILKPMRERRRGNRPLGLANSLRGAGQGAADPVWEQLSEIPAPCLVISGAADHKYGEVSVAMVEAMSHARHTVIPDAGHCAHLENLDATCSILSEFLAEVSE